MNFTDPMGLTSDLEGCLKKAEEWLSLCNKGYAMNYKLCVGTCNIWGRLVGKRRACIAACAAADRKAKEWCREVYKSKVDGCYGNEPNEGC